MAKNLNKQAKTHDIVSRWNILPDELIDNIFYRITFPFIDQLTISPTTFDIELLSSSIHKTSQFWNTLENICTIFTSLSTTIVRLHLSYTFVRGLSDYASLQRFIISWTHHLLRRSNIQQLEIDMDFGGELGARNIFQMHSLVTLDLHNLGKYGFAWKLPRWINLPNLKKLSLMLNEFKELEQILTYCPSLEDLSVIFDTQCEVSVMVSTEKLKRLYINVYWFSNFVVIIDAPNLEHLNLGSQLRSNSGDLCLCLRLEHSVSNVKSLVLDLVLPTRVYNSPNKTNNFPNLTHLTLTLGSFERFEAFGTVLHCPNLEVIVLNVTSFLWISSVPNDMTFGLFKQVKRLELDMKVVRFDKQLNFATYLLRSSPVLETLSLSAKRKYDPPYNNVQYGMVDEAQFFRSLLEGSRISESCQIEFSGAYNDINPCFPCMASQQDEI